MIDRVARVNPDNPEAYVLRASIATRNNELDAAEWDLRHALSLSPQSSAIRLEIAAILHRLGRFEESLSFIDDSLAVEPQSVLANVNRGLLLKELGEFDKAERALRVAAGLGPGNATINTYLASVLSDIGKIDEARTILSDVLKKERHHSDAHWTLATIELAAGHFATGWENYEYRLMRKDVHVRPRDLPWWQPESAYRGGVLVLAEQGLGDEIMFASCIGDLLKTMDDCSIECDPRLGSLFSRSFPRARILPVRDPRLPKGPAVNGVRTQIAAGSLPRYFRCHRNMFPEDSRYLRASPERVAHWRERLSTLGMGLKVGLAWTGGAVKTRRAFRSLALKDVEPILRVPGVEFVSLQYMHCEDEIEEFARQTGVRVHDWPEAIGDYDETASLVTALDLVVSVTTALVHLTGALGKPVWVLVPAIPEWRYMRSGATMPWYSSAKLFRQPVLDHWEPVVEEVRGELQRCARRHKLGQPVWD